MHKMCQTGKRWRKDSQGCLKNRNDLSTIHGWWADFGSDQQSEMGSGQMSSRFSPLFRDHPEITWHGKGGGNLTCVPRQGLSLRGEAREKLKGVLKILRFQGAEIVFPKGKSIENNAKWQKISPAALPQQHLGSSKYLRIVEWCESTGSTMTLYCMMGFLGS